MTFYNYTGHNLSDEQKAINWVLNYMRPAGPMYRKMGIHWREFTMSSYELKHVMQKDTTLYMSDEDFKVVLEKCDIPKDKKGRYHFYLELHLLDDDGNLITMF